jgi:hypothetical protein
MRYRPNFCCNCGEKIERAEWTFLSSRKFCDLCQTQLTAHEWGPKIIAVVALMLGTAVVTSLFRPAGAGTKVSQDQLFASQAAAESRTVRNLNTTSQVPLQSQPGANTNASPVVSRPVETKTSANVVKSSEPIYYCGAATKKGTPCSRRVKHPGERCWQHIGMPSVADAGLNK